MVVCFWEKQMATTMLPGIEPGSVNVNCTKMKALIKKLINEMIKGTKTQ